MDKHHREITLFGGLRISIEQARATIRAYSGAETIREWSSANVALLKTPIATQRELPQHARQGNHHEEQCNPNYYASVRMCVSGNHAEVGLSLTGSGESPSDAIEDLLWQLVTPHLLADCMAPTALPVSEAATCR